MKDSIPVVAMALGIPLVILSLVWPLIFPATNSWTEEKAVKMADLGKELKFVAAKIYDAETQPSIVGQENLPELKSEQREKTKELEALRKEFENQRDKPQTIATYLRWVGIVLVILGGAASFVSRG